MPRLRTRICYLLAILLAAARGAAGGEPTAPAKPRPIPIADVKRSEAVHFEKEVLPILSRKCLACHNTTTHENQLVLESPAAILKGGENGPAVTPGNPAKSLLLSAASRQIDAVMPPEDNDVGAAPLTPTELGLLKLWIEQGATGSVSGASSAIHWQPLPPGVNPIYAVAMTEDGQWAACSRANQIFLYHVPSARLITRLTDPALAADPSRRGVAHLEMVHSLAFSPDGSLLASGGFREIKLWRRPRNAPKWVINGETEIATALATSRDDRWLATGYPSGVIKLWEAESGRLAKTLAGDAEPATAEPAAAEPAAKGPETTGAVTALDFLHDNNRLASASADKLLRVWNIADGAVAQRKELPNAAQSLAVMSDDARMAAAGPDKTLSIWKLAGNELISIDAAAAPITALAAAANDPDRLYSGHADNSIRQWSLDAKKQTRQMDQGGAVTAIAVRGDGRQMASAGANNIVKQWNLENGQPWHGPNNQATPPLTGDFSLLLAVSRSERRVAALSAKAAGAKQAAADADSLVKSTAEAIKSANEARETAARVKTEKAQAAKEPTEKKAAADQAVAAAAAEKAALDERLAQARGAAEKDAANQDLAKERDDARKQAEEVANKLKSAENAARDLAPPAAQASQALLSAEAASAAADQNAVASLAANQKAIDAAPLAQAAQRDADKALADAQAELDTAKQAIENAKRSITALAYSPDGQTLATAGDSQTVSLWDTVSGVSIGADTGSCPVTAVAFAHGLLLATAEHSVTAWSETEEWKLERMIGAADNSSLLADRVLAVAFSPDGSLLASGGGEPTRGGELKLWNPADGNLVKNITPAHSDTIFAVEFSPDGKRLASAGADRLMKVFDVAGGSLVRAFEGHTHHVLGVAWRADGNLLATAGADNTIKFWDFASGEQAQQPQQGSKKELTAVRFLALSNKAVVAGADHQARTYDSSTNGGAERTFSGPSDFLYSLAISGDGKWMIGGGQDSVLWLWNVENGQVLHKFEPPGN